MINVNSDVALTEEANFVLQSWNMRQKNGKNKLQYMQLN